MHLHLGAGAEQRFDQHERGTLAHVVRLGLEREAPDGDGALIEVADVALQLFEQHVLLRLVRLLHRIQNAERHFVLGAGAHQRLDVLGEAGAAVPRAREQERLSDTPVGADAAPHLSHIGADGLAQPRDLIHEGDPRGQHGVGRVFRHLGRRDVHHDQGIAGAHEGRVQLFDHAGRLVRIHAHDDAIGLHEVLDRRPFLQELGVRADVERRRGAFGDLGPNLLGRANGDGALGHHELALVHVIADRARDGQHVLQIGRSVLVGGRADGDEDDLGALHRLRHVGHCASSAALMRLRKAMAWPIPVQPACPAPGCIRRRSIRHSWSRARRTRRSRIRVMRSSIAAAPLRLAAILPRCA